MDPNTTPRAEEPDSRNSLRHILATEPSLAMEDLTPPDPEPSLPPDDDDGQDDRAPKSATSSKGPGSELPMYTATTTTTRRNANGSVSSVYSGNKIRHLKKDDGIPLWRRDIQYDFLRYVFEDDQRVFHKVSDGTGGHTFADIYLDAMAKSSKCSKILKDKLLTERAAAINMAMVCLLVNVGRMNTTLNFFPEMRAQLRTYHSIPSLQAHQDPNAYKQLQDAPRLKSILKGATEDIEQPSTIEDIKNHAVPRTNPVNLIFVLAQYAPKISEIHFYPPRDFFDLVMRSALSSRSRATAFLWLMWWYLESDFTSEAAQNNPFGPGLPGTEGDATGGMPIKCPAFKHLTEDEMALENVDTDEEKNFGDIKRKERIAILASDMAPVVTGPKRTGKKAFNQNPVFSVLADDGASTPGRDHQSPSHGSSKGSRKPMPNAKSLAMDYASDTDRTRSPSPHQRPTSVYGGMTDKKGTPNMRINTLLNDETPSVSTPPKGPGRGNWSRNRNNGTVGRNAFKNKLEASQDGTSPSTNGPTVSLHTSGPHGFYLPLNGSDPSHKRSRPLTQHQLAVEQFRRKRVEVILDRGLRKQYKVAKRRREDKGAFWLAWLRCKLLPDGYDTDEDENEQAAHYGDSDIGTHGKHIPLGFGGLLPVRDAEKVDCGEEAYNRAKVMNRVARRLERWEGGVEAVKRKKKNGTDLVWVDTEGDREERGDSQMDYENGDGDVDDQMDEDDREMLEAAGVYDSEDEQMDDYDRELEAAEQS
ncbi:hypothetical protein BU16DRAFT_523897 [Lophium mytilinum]|uniref:Ino eighty subunit 1 n=1 Tax=Lophium mytilinum TaxID=390894 RepID=A0A6A6R7F1_9PEZI|nr:hypothetical protein BU16DRAFT_523897 [Lophium mytilinum]